MATFVSKPICFAWHFIRYSLINLILLLAMTIFCQQLISFMSPSNTGVEAGRFYIPGIYEAPHDDPKYRATASGALPSSVQQQQQQHANNTSSVDNSIACPTYHICHEPFGPQCFARIAYCREQYLQLGCDYPSEHAADNPRQDERQDDTLDYNNYVEQLNMYPCAYLTVYPFLYQNQSINGMQAWTAYVGLRRMAFSRDLRHKWLNDCRNAVAHVGKYKRQEQFIQCTRQNCSSVDVNQMEEAFRERRFVCNLMQPTTTTRIVATNPTSISGNSNNNGSKSYALDEVLGAQMHCVVGHSNITPSSYELGVHEIDHYLRPDSQELIGCLRRQGIDYELLKNVHEAPYGYVNEFCTGLAGFIRCAYHARCATEHVKRLVWFGLQMSFECSPEAVRREVIFTEANRWGIKSAADDDLALSHSSPSTSSGGAIKLKNCGIVYFVLLLLTVMLCCCSRPY